MERDKSPETRQSEPFRVRLPGFVTDEEIGLGDVIRGTTYALGIKPCSGCERRAAALNRWMTFSGLETSQKRGRMSRETMSTLDKSKLPAAEDVGHGRTSNN